MKAQCKRCGKWFKISSQLNDLIEGCIIHPLEVNLCEECAEEANEEAIFEAELECILNNL